MVGEFTVIYFRTGTLDRFCLFNSPPISNQILWNKSNLVLETPCICSNKSLIAKGIVVSPSGPLTRVVVFNHIFLSSPYNLFIVRPLCTSFHCIDETTDVSKSVSNLSQSLARGHLLILLMVVPARHICASLRIILNYII